MEQFFIWIANTLLVAEEVHSDWYQRRKLNQDDDQYLDNIRRAIAFVGIAWINSYMTDHNFINSLAFSLMFFFLTFDPAIALSLGKGFFYLGTTKGWDRWFKKWPTFYVYFAKFWLALVVYYLYYDWELVFS
ncbi:MAG: hypothetical protein AAF363_15695 [Bacteroidota bacterium]